MSNSADYSDYRKWKEVSCDNYYFSEYAEYQTEDILEICTKLMKDAKAQGLVGCYLKFQSHIDYDNYPDNASVCVTGHRPLNDSEKVHIEREDLIDRVAKEKGIPPYQARKLVELQELGVV